MSSELDDLKRQLAELKEQIAAKEKAEELPA